MLHKVVHQCSDGTAREEIGNKNKEKRGDSLEKSVLDFVEIL